MGDQGATRGGAARILELADRQHRVVATWQLLALGLTKAQIHALVRKGWLIPVRRGVYAVGTRKLSRHGGWMAAVLSCGRGAALSSRAAAELWGFYGSDEAICVTVPTDAGRSRSDFKVRRSTDFDRTVHRGVPVTTVPWTLVDLAAELHFTALLGAIDEAERLHIWRWSMFPSLSERRHGARGMKRLARARAKRDPLSVKTRSQLERRFLALCRRFSLPPPALNVALLDGRYYADFLWEEAKLIIETDGRETHGTSAAFENDRDRDTSLAAYGYQTLRFTWRKIHDEPAVVANRIARTLRVRGIGA